MTFLKNIWYVAAFASEVAEDKPLDRVIAEVPLLLLRGWDGRLTAMLDRCAHRFAPLSQGIISQDRVQCRYHGLTYDMEGSCVHNPHGPIVNALRVPTYPVEERHGLIWVWLGERDLADPATIIDLSLIKTTPATALNVGYILAHANHQLLVDNILDLTHADYLHPASLGGAVNSRPKVREQGSTVVVDWVQEAVKAMPIHQPLLPKPDTLVDSWATVTWYPGGAMLLSNGSMLPGADKWSGNWSHAAHIMSPQDGRDTHYFYLVYRSWDQDSIETNRLLEEGLKIAFNEEDKPMIEAQQRRIGDHDIMELAPVLLGIDAGSGRARQIYNKLLRAEAA